MNAVVGLTPGDAEGVGMEMILRMLSDEAMTERFTPLIYGSSKVAVHYRKALEIPNLALNVVTDALQVAKGKINLLNVGNEDIKSEGEGGERETGKWAAEALKRAMEDVKAGKIVGVVSGPIASTPYKEEETAEGELLRKQRKSTTLMVKGRIRVASLTQGVEKQDVAAEITHERIVKKVREMVRTLREDFGVDRARVVVMSLNEKNENGEYGKEEADVIVPAIKQLCDEGVLCFGPIESKRYFDEGEHRNYDAGLALYEAQGFGEMKSLVGDDAVRFVELDDIVWTTSTGDAEPEKAGKNVVEIDGFRNAVYSVLDVNAQRGRRAQEAKVIPLEQ